MKILDWITTAGAGLAAFSLGFIAVSYCYEVVSRYFFNSPTTWISATTTYLLLVAVMMMFPHVTRERGHVSVTFLLERMGPAGAKVLTNTIIVVTLAICALSLWFAWQEMSRHYSQDVRMLDSMLVPKWWLSIWFVYGFLGSALQLLRHFGETGAHMTPHAPHPGN